ncbi:hypothetical protein BH11PSE2_BH11PSE2_17460 [soil metagenome]
MPLSARRVTLALAVAMTALGGAWAARAPAPAKPAARPAAKPTYDPRDLDGTWTNAWLTKTERPKDFTTLIIPEAQAAEYEAKNAGKVKPEKDLVGQETSEFPEVGEQLARIRGQARSSWIYDPADGKIPYTEAVKAANKARTDFIESNFDNPDARGLDERCVGATKAGPPLRNGADSNVIRIVQTRDQLAIESEADHNLRLVRIGGTHGPEAARRWMGDSVGRWEGDTLVVETVRFHPLQLGAAAGAPGADSKVIERFTRTGADEITYDFIVENPALYTQTWRGEMILRPSKGPIYEYACHEGNYGLEFILAGARQAEAGVKAADVVGVVKGEAASAVVAVTKAEKDATAGGGGK